MYADDTNIFFSGSSIRELQYEVNRYLEMLSKWLHENNLQLNASKTTYIIFRPINKKIDQGIHIEYRGNMINQVKEQKFLGVWFHEELSWHPHIEHLGNEISKNIGVLYRLRGLIPLWLKTQLYNTLVYSRLCYGILAWGTTNKTNYKRLIVLQKRVLRLFANFHGHYADLRTGPLFVQYSMLKADQIYYMKLLQAIHKENLHGKHNGNSSIYPLRCAKIHTPKLRTNYGRQSSLFQRTDILNKVGDHIDFKCSRNIFKTQAKEYLLNQNICFNG